MYVATMAAETVIAVVINNQVAPPLPHCYVAEGGCVVQFSGCLAHESNVRRIADRPGMLCVRRHCTDGSRD